MDITHRLLLELIALAAAPILFAIVAVVVSWRSLTHHLVFSAVVFLSFSGLWSIVYSVILLMYESANASNKMYIVPAFNALAVTAIVVAGVGFPIIWLLRNALRGDIDLLRSTP